MGNDNGLPPVSSSQVSPIPSFDSFEATKNQKIRNSHTEESVKRCSVTLQSSSSTQTESISRQSYTKGTHLSFSSKNKAKKVSFVSSQSSALAGAFPSSNSSASSKISKTLLRFQAENPRTQEHSTVESKKTSLSSPSSTASMSHEEESKSESEIGQSSTAPPSTFQQRRQAFIDTSSIKTNILLNGTPDEIKKLKKELTETLESKVAETTAFVKNLVENENFKKEVKIPEKFQFREVPETPEAPKTPEPPIKPFKVEKDKKKLETYNKEMEVYKKDLMFYKESLKIYKQRMDQYKAELEASKEELKSCYEDAVGITVVDEESKFDKMIDKKQGQIEELRKEMDKQVEELRKKIDNKEIKNKTSISVKDVDKLSNVLIDKIMNPNSKDPLVFDKSQNSMKKYNDLKSNVIILNKGLFDLKQKIIEIKTIKTSIAEADKKLISNDRDLKSETYRQSKPLGSKMEEGLSHLLSHLNQCEIALATTEIIKTQYGLLLNKSETAELQEKSIIFLQELTTNEEKLQIKKDMHTQDVSKLLHDDIREIKNEIAKNEFSLPGYAIGIQQYKAEIEELSKNTDFLEKAQDLLAELPDLSKDADPQITKMTGDPAILDNQAINQDPYQDF